MQVVAGSFGEVKVYDVTHERNINPTRGQVSCDQHLGTIDLGLKVFEIAFADAGRDIAMHACSLDLLLP